MSVLLRGVAAAPGLAMGQVTVWSALSSLYVAPSVGVDSSVLRRVAARVADQLRTLETDLAARAGPQAAAIFGAQALMAEDPELLEAVEERLGAGIAVDQAVRDAGESIAAVLEALDDARLRQRSADVRDVAARLAKAFGMNDEAVATPWPSTVLVAADLPPSVVVGLDTVRVKAIVTAAGGPTSHTSILARGLGIPYISGCADVLERVHDGVWIAVDGDSGEVIVAPGSDELQACRQRARNAEVQGREAQPLSDGPAITRAGRRILVSANLGSSRESVAAASAGADGVGLFRTEFLFLGRATPPSEEEQFAEYRAVAEAMAPHPVVIRTLDAGGDKQLPFLDLPREDNPYLGWRGVRLWLEREDLAVPQLRALLRAARFGHLEILVPMVTDAGEIRRARALIERVGRELGEEAGTCRFGVMIEVPAAALLAEQLAAQVDFFSIGTNDLAQYTLAADRGNARTASMYELLHPAVLRLIEMAVTGARARGIPVAVCGDIASDRRAIPRLVELGVDQLSVPVPAVARTRNLIRAL